MILFMKLHATKHLLLSDGAQGKDPWFLSGERKLRAKTREQQRRTETAEKRGLTKNIMTVVPVSPTRLVCHEKYLKDGLRARMQKSLEYLR